MKTFAITALSIAALSLSACATHAPHGVEDAPLKLSSSDSLLSGIAADKITVDGVSPNKLSETNSTCVQFYSNTAKYAGRPQGGTYAKGFGKTILLGLLAGAASGGVASMGIGSAFLETAVAGTANQVVYQGGSAALSKTGSGSDTDKVAEAANQIGCPKPDLQTLKAAQKAAKKAAKLAAKDAKKAAKAGEKVIQ